MNKPKSTTVESNGPRFPAELKAKITKRWNIITGHQTLYPFNQGEKSTAFAQLEYILIEAGLLAERRERPSERAMRLSRVPEQSSDNMSPEADGDYADRETEAERNA